MNILVICHYFAPEPAAPSARLLELAREWQKRGHTVKVVTCFPNHPTGMIPPEYRGRLRSREWMEGIEVYRNWVFATPNEGVVKKTLSHLSFMFSSVLFSLRRTGPADVVIASSPTFFTLFSGYFFSRWKHAPLVAEIRDLWPAAIIELGVLKNRQLIRVLEAMEMWAYRVSHHVVTVTDAFKQNLVARGVPGTKVSVVTNGVDLDRFTPGPKVPEVEAELDCRDRTLVLYIGAHGMSQGLHTVLEAANQLRAHPHIVFAFVGEGAVKQQLQHQALDLGLDNVRFLPAQSKQRVVDFYRTADICLVPLRNVPLFRTFIPSKMFEIMGCGRPIVAALEGEAAEILERSGGAEVVPPEAPALLAEAILKLIQNSDVRRQMAEKAECFARTHYSRSRLAEKYLDILSMAATEV